ncbi:hypothetical protein [Beijerinckia sp. L45]|uniref:hypothetical protein n=1 Tax=Beijerinckia sp. L45 TaxID=1641855 RepID=UPI00131D7D75|nr:hypothetical protein [Beijerinckia sp. L45]
MWKFLQTLTQDVISTKSAKIAILAFVISTLCFSVILIVFGYSYSKDYGIQAAEIPLWLRTTLSFGFLLFFVLLWFILYIQISREADDLYSDIRMNLKGNWAVKYQASNGVQADPFLPPLRVDCDIHINPENKKLEMEFNVSDNPIYAPGKQIINSVALSHDSGSRYSLFYYYNEKRKINGQLWRYLIEDDDFSKVEGIEIEFFGILYFERSLTEKRVMLMEGEWFDLNGKVTQLFSLVDLVRKNENQLAQKLSAAYINNSNFAAKMGKIQYERLG